MFSFTEGMQALPLAIYERMKNNIILDAEVTSVEKTASGYSVHYSANGENKTIETDILLSTIQAFELSGIVSGLDPELANRLNSIYHPPVMVLFLVYKTADIRQPLDGFGFLIPEKEKRAFLGALWSSVILRTAPRMTLLFTLFIADPECGRFAYLQDQIIATQ
jgi:oxygen-dependent protoporphyrinogen oxidase